MKEGSVISEIEHEWTVAVTFDRTAHHTRAHAVLRTPDGDEFSGIGLAHSALEGRGLAHVAPYLAVERALSDLTQEFLETVATDVDTAMSRIDEIGLHGISIGGNGAGGIDAGGIDAEGIGAGRIDAGGINAAAPTSQGGRRRPGAMRA
ncbi:MAG TPA: dsRBD fold-containing protein [Amycolatopsis sp.]|nr:dsRBD fold-containing protein [Amycolatopsis sp.]